MSQCLGVLGTKVGISLATFSLSSCKSTSRHLLRVIVYNDQTVHHGLHVSKEGEDEKREKEKNERATRNITLIISSFVAHHIHAS